MEDILKGMKLLHDKVSSTLGPKGENVIICNNGKPIVTKDGATVAHSITSENVKEQAGIELLREVAVNTCNRVGDATTTATVLAYNMISSLLDAKKNNRLEAFSNNDIIKELEECQVKIEEHLKSQIIKPDLKDVFNISMVATNSDAELSWLIDNAYSSTGQFGKILLDISKTGKSYVSRDSGSLIPDRGALSRSLLEDGKTTKLDDANILLYEGKITTYNQINKLFKLTDGKPLLIVADDVSGAALETIAMRAIRHKAFDIQAIKAPGMGNMRKNLMEDLAILIGATYITNENGVSLENITEDHFGKVSSVVIKESSVTMRGCNGNRDAINHRIGFLKRELSNSLDQEKPKYNERIAFMEEGMTTLYIGAETDTEIRETYDRAEDAVLAVSAAFKEGILPGGGIALLRAGVVLMECGNQISEVVAKVLRKPYIMLNPTEKDTPRIQEVIKDSESDEPKIYDPYLAEITAVKNAISLAKSMVNTKYVIE